ncbi:helix-turn-helix domain-containing protein [Escherichia coli]|nr:helix-turn-helix domain-containing protein [Escherichia coli]
MLRRALYDTFLHTHSNKHQNIWAHAGRLIASGVHRQNVAIIYDVSVTTVYKKFPAGENENIARRSQVRASAV